MQRNRIFKKNSAIRNLISETSLLPHNLIYPMFICKNGIDPQIPSMPGIFRYTIDGAKNEIKHLMRLGISCFMLFPYVSQDEKDELGTLALSSENIICRAIKEIKNSSPEAIIMADVALDPYTSHGHDGVLNLEKNDVDNDKTVEILVKQALIQAKCGADFITPSDMMDGRIAKIRSILDENSLNYTGIISYSAKYSSNLYAPFRGAINSGIKAGPVNKHTYQSDFRNEKFAIKEVMDDVNQGANGIIIKPAGWYLDIIKACTNAVNVPIFAYQVSGEYAMIQNICSNDGVNLYNLALESVTCIKRAGASGIITYFSKIIAENI